MSMNNAEAHKAFKVQVKWKPQVEFVYVRGERVSTLRPETHMILN